MLAGGGRVEASDSISTGEGSVEASDSLLADDGRIGTDGPVRPVHDRAVGRGVEPVDSTVADSGGVEARVEVADGVVTAITEEYRSVKK